nr:DUF547 domain-containing protein [Acidobacteriota bacterium]
MILRTSAILLLAAALPLAQQAAPADVSPRDRAYDHMLDINVRDGLVYYNAVKASRGTLASYIESLDVSPVAFARLPREGQMALLINAYNAIALHTAASAYPISGRVGDFPAKSIRQLPGAFDRKHGVAGRTVSLDELERWLIDDYDDPRVIFALGRGAVGSGRLKSEAYTAVRLEAQLADATREFAMRAFRMDQAAGTVVVSPLYSWREKDLAAAYADKADPAFKDRSAIERAILALTLEHLFPSEQA